MTNAKISGGVGFPGLLALLFIGLKLGHVIDWSWWWVLSPLWIPAALFLTLSVFFFVMIVIVAIIQMMYENKKPRQKAKFRGL